MKQHVSNAEVDRILEEIHQKQSAQAVSNQLVDQVLQSIHMAEGGTNTTQQSVPPAQEPVAQPKTKARPKPQPQPIKKEQHSKPSQSQPTEKVQQSTEEFEIPVVPHALGEGKGVVVDDRFRDFFTQTALEIDPEKLRAAKKEKKPTLRQRLNQVKEQQAKREEEKQLEQQKAQYEESQLQEDVGFSLEEQQEQQAREEIAEDKQPTKAFSFSKQEEPEPEEWQEQTGEFSLQLDQPIWDEPLEPLHEQEQELEPEDLEQKTQPFELEPELPPEEPQEEPEEPTRVMEQLEEKEGQKEESTSDQPEEQVEPKKKKKGFGLRLFGGEEEPEEPESEQEEEEEGTSENHEKKQPKPVVEDYDCPEQAAEVQDTLLAMTAKNTVKTIVSALVAVVLLWLGMGAARFYSLPGFIDPAIEPMPFLIVNLILLVVVIVLCIGTIKDGIVGFFTKPSMDTMPTLALLGALVQAIAFVAFPKNFEPATFSLFSGVAVVCLCMNLLGERLQNRVVSKNFEMASSQLEHWAACIITDRERVSEVAKGLHEPEPRLLVSRPTALVQGFLKQSFSLRKSEKNARKLCYLILATGLLAAVVGGWMANSVTVGASVFAATVCLSTPFASTLLYAVPSLLMQKHAGRVGAVVPGWSAMEELGKTNMVLVGAKDLFPAGTVSLKGIKTFEKERIDLAILYATSILVEGCDTMREVFSELVQGKTDILYPVESFTHEVGCGYSAWINDERVLIGNREMMLRHGLTPPSEEWEARCSKDGERQLLYLAVSGKLFGVFGLEYKADDMVNDVIHSLYRRGISLLIKSDDCCLTEELIAQIYDLPQESVKILGQQERKTLGPELIFRTQSEGVMTHLGSFASFVGGLRAAENAAAGENLATMVQTAAVVFSCVVSLALTVSGGLISLALPAALLYQASWTVLQLAMPLSKQY